MLPLDKLTDAAAEGFEAHGVSRNEIVLALLLDMDADGQFGETWLCVDKAHDLHILSASAETNANTVRVTSNLVDENLKRKHKPGETVSPISAEKFAQGEMRTYSGEDLGELSVDNFLTSERLYALINGKTTILAESTNAKKQKMYAFIDLYERLKKDEDIPVDDPIFDQFNAKCPKCGKIYVDQQRKICNDCVNHSAVMVRLLGYMKDFKGSLAVIILCLIATSVISLVSPLISCLFLYDNVIDSAGKFHNGWGPFSELQMVWVACAAVFLVALLSTGIGIIKSRCSAHVASKVTINMKMDVFTAMQNLSLSFFNNAQTGSLITRVNYDADTLRGFFSGELPAFIVNAANYIGLMIVCLSLNWKLTLIILIPVPLVVLMLRIKLPKLWRMYTKRWRRSSALNAMLSDSLTGVRVVKAFAKEDVETNRFYTVSQKLHDTNLELNMVSLTIFPIIGLLIGISSYAIWGFGGIEVMNKHMTYGEFSAFWSYVGMIFGPLQFFTNFVDVYTNAANCAGRMFEILDTVPDINECKNPVDLDTTMRGEIEFDRVNFHYVANRPILKDMSLHIHAGDNIGLVGHTGAGKSTIANLISRLYDVTSGRIMIDGVNVKDIKISSLRKNIAIVSQEIFLFKGTIADNIRYAVPDATLDEVIAAAKIANAHDFILSLPDGYETVIGTGSRSLSGGEKQRISIARAVLLAPRILILDEATAAMDTETERLIQDALAELTKGRTTITIAHRLSTLKDCNYLFAIENGEIAEEGTHVELLNKKGIYYKLYTIQTEAMKKVIAGM